MRSIYVKILLNHYPKNFDQKKFYSLFDYIYILELINNDVTDNLSRDINIKEDMLRYYYKKAKSMIFNINYGFDIDNKYVICSPFLRKDTPIKKSNFSSLLLRLILTFISYIKNYNMELQDTDYNKIYNNEQYLYDLVEINNKLDEYIFQVQSACENDKKKIFTIDNIKNILIKLDTDAVKKVIKQYLFSVNIDELKYTSKQLNISFQDIIYNKYDQWQVGYTGTVSLNLNKYDTNDKCVFREIIPDYDEKIEILLALRNIKNKKSNNIKILLPATEYKLDETLKSINDFLIENNNFK